MRRFLLRLLLLAVCFNAAIGLPLHQAEHLRIDASAVAALAAEDDDAELPHAACAWCVAHAAAVLPGSPPAAPAPWVEAAHVAPTPAVAVWSAAPVRWPFASRAPPLV